MESVLRLSDNLDIKVVEKNEDENYLVLQIENYEQMLKIGSKSWCIATSESYFNSYVNDSSTQYIYYDFKLDKTDEKSMIGLTYNKGGGFEVGFFKDDSEVEIENVYLANEIIESYIFDLNEVSKAKNKIKI